MRSTIYLILLLQFGLSKLIAQTHQAEASKIIEELSNKYGKYNSVEIFFDFIIEEPEGEKRSQEGKLIQKGSKFSLDMDDQAIVSDGSIVWVFLKDNNEVQIDNADPDEESISSFSPKNLLEHFNSEFYDYAINSEKTQKGIRYTDIEFKPLDNDSEYSKMRISINRNKNAIEHIKLFSKDGSKYSVSLKSVIPDKNYSKEIFIFNPAKYPGIYIEDLRID